MKVFINQQEFSIAAEDSLKTFLAVNNFVQEGTAVAVNGTIVPKSDWETFKLNDKDQLILIRATAGG